MNEFVAFILIPIFFWLSCILYVVSGFKIFVIDYIKHKRNKKVFYLQDNERRYLNWFYIILMILILILGILYSEREHLVKSTRKFNISDYHLD